MPTQYMNHLTSFLDTVAGFYDHMLLNSKRLGLTQANCISFLLMCEWEEILISHLKRICILLYKHVNFIQHVMEGEIHIADTVR